MLVLWANRHAGTRPPVEVMSESGPVNPGKREGAAVVDIAVIASAEEHAVRNPRAGVDTINYVSAVDIDNHEVFNAVVSEVVDHKFT